MMIQRIQTLYLLIIAALMAVTLFSGLAWFAGDAGEFGLYAFGLKPAEGELVQSTVYMGVLLALVIKTFATGARSEDLLGSYICAGIGGALMAQIAVNVGMNLRVLPVIGVTLPFYSAGGSSVLMLYICVGLVLSVYMHNTKSLFG